MGIGDCGEAMPVGAMGSPTGYPGRLPSIMKTKPKQTKSGQTITVAHVQMNTAHECVVRRSRAEACCRELAEIIRRHGGPVPGADGYRCEIRAGHGMAHYKIERGNSLIAVGTVAWSQEGEALAWKSAQLAGSELGPIPVVFDNSEVGGLMPPPARKPASLPWAATSLQRGALDGQTPEACQKLGEFESGLACAIVAAARSGRLRHPVFGRVG